ncbi:BppU family phage baseplate upper protein, partial [Enterococcus faecium]
MASSLYNLALDFSKELNYTKAIMARQGDKGITVTVKPFLNGLQMDTSGGTFTLKGTTPSNRYVDSVATSVTSEEVTFSLDGTFMSEAGYYKHCYVEYRKDNQILTTQDIIFFSLGVSDISQGQADEYVSQLEELIRKYNETFDAFMAEIKGRVDSLNKQITDLTGQAKTLQDKLDALKEEISKLGNLQVMYSNSIDFGDYDYSGNPNLMSKLKSSDFNIGYHGSLTLDNEKLHFTSDGTGSIIMFTRINTPQLASGKTYTLSAKVRFDEGTTGAIDKLRLVYRTSPGEKILLEANSTNITTDDVGKEIT